MVNQEAKNRPKIQEVEVKSEQKTAATEVSPEAEKDTPSPSKVGKVKLTKGVDEATVAKASAVATLAAN